MTEAAAGHIAALDWARLWLVAMAIAPATGIAVAAWLGRRRDGRRQGRYRAALWSARMTGDRRLVDRLHQHPRG